MAKFALVTLGHCLWAWFKSIVGGVMGGATLSRSPFRSELDRIVIT